MFFLGRTGQYLFIIKSNNRFLNSPDITSHCLYVEIDCKQCLACFVLICYESVNGKTRLRSDWILFVDILLFYLYVRYQVLE